MPINVRKCGRMAAVEHVQLNAHRIAAECIEARVDEHLLPWHAQRGCKI